MFLIFILFFVCSTVARHSFVVSFACFIFVSIISSDNLLNSVFIICLAWSGNFYFSNFCIKSSISNRSVNIRYYIFNILLFFNKTVICIISLNFLKAIGTVFNLSTSSFSTFNFKPANPTVLAESEVSRSVAFFKSNFVAELDRLIQVSFCFHYVYTVLEKNRILYNDIFFINSKLCFICNW